MKLSVICAVTNAALVLCSSHNAVASSCVLLSEAKYTPAAANFTPFYEEATQKGIRVIIGFRKKLDDLNIALIVPGRIIHKLRLVNAIAAEVPAAALEVLSQHPDIRSIELDGKVHALELPFATATPATEPDPSANQVVPPGIQRVGAPSAWSQTTGKGVKVAIIDTGIDKNHPDLAGRVSGGQNFSSADRAAWNDGHGHGTHVSGTVAATNNKIGVVGVAPEASLIGIKVLDDSGSGQYSDVVAGVEYAINARADVANMSLGGTRDVQALHEALIKGHERGIIFAVAAGNSGEDYDNPLNYPGAYPEVVGTAAVDDADLRAYFSTYSKFVALAGPGLNVLSLDKGAAYARHSGTSMATPHVAGVAALLKQAFANESVVDLKRRMVCNADDQFPMGRDIWTGHGIVNVTKALASAAPESCGYLRGVVTEPAIPEPVTRPAPGPSTKVIYVKSLNLKLINDGTKKQLLVTASIVDQNFKPQANLSVTSEIMERGTGPLGSAVAITDLKGEARFSLKGFTCGRFIANIKQADAAEFSTEYGQAAAALDL